MTELTDEQISALEKENLYDPEFPRDGVDAIAFARAIIQADRAQRQAEPEMAAYAEARVQADRAARQAEQGPCGWMQNIDKAMQEPLFQALRGIMGTENMGQDMALLQTIRHYRAKTPSEVQRQAGQEPVMWRYQNNETVVMAMPGYTPGTGWTPLFAAPQPAAHLDKDAEIEKAVLAERERCALLADKEKNSSLRNAEHHQAFDNHNAVAKWESRALACAVIACEIRQAAP